LGDSPERHFCCARHVGDPKTDVKIEGLQSLCLDSHSQRGKLLEHHLLLLPAGSLAMSKRLESSPPRSAQVASSDVATPDATLPSVAWRWGLSVLIVWHVWAVLGEPVEFMTRLPFSMDGSPAGVAFNAPVRAYGEFTYLNHGYAFFAPDPGPSHLMEVRWAGADGSESKETYPDLAKQWPRLLYHRHFMLTEFLNNVHSAPVPLDLQQETGSEIAAWRASRRQYEAIRDSFRRHVAGRQDVSVDAVVIDRIEHRAPYVPEYLVDNVRLRDSQLYMVLPDTVEPELPPAPPVPPAPVGGTVWQDGPEVMPAGAPQLDLSAESSR